MIAIMLLGLTGFVCVWFEDSSYSAHKMELLHRMEDALARTERVVVLELRLFGGRLCDGDVSPRIWPL